MYRLVLTQSMKLPREDAPPPSVSAAALTAPLEPDVSARVSMPIKSSNSPYTAAACPPSIPKVLAWASMHWVKRRQALERLSADRLGLSRTRKSSAWTEMSRQINAQRG